MAKNNIQFSVGFNVDKASLNQLTSALQEVQNQSAKFSSMNKLSGELKEAGKAAKTLEGILNDSWNSKLGQLDLSKVDSGIKNTYGSLQKLKTTLEGSGATGAAAYNKVASSILNTNLQLKTSNKLLDDMADTMTKTVKWGITSSIFNQITGSIQKAYYYTKDLDGSLNDIRIVTDKSADSMSRFAKEANAASKELRASTLDYTDASLIYYQQGLADDEVKARTETTLKTANVTKQAADVVSEQLTAVWNGYKVSAEESELYIDKLAAVAASTASDLEELSTGMSKVASGASAMGVDVDQLNAQLSTIVSVTRQAPESVGTALKTIYARLGDLKVDGADEFGTTLGDVSGKMLQMGVAVTDETSNLREMGTVIEEVAGKWGTWTEAQKQAAAVAMAGKRQYNNLIALFDNWDMYTSALDTSANAAGTLQKQQDIYMESAEAHLQQLRTEAERTYGIIFDTETINTYADSMTYLLTEFNDFIGGLGGGGTMLMNFGAMFANVFNKQIGTAITNQIANIESFIANSKGINLKQEAIDTVKLDHTLKGESLSSPSLQKEADIAEKTLAVRKALTAEQYNEITASQQKIGLLEEQIQDIQNYKDILTTLQTVEIQKGKNVYKDLDANLSLKSLESIKSQRQEDLELQEKALFNLELIMRGRRSEVDLTEKETGLLKEMNVSQRNIVTTLTKGKTTQEKITKAIEAQRSLISTQKEDLVTLNDVIIKKKQTEDGTLQNLKAEQAEREKLIAQQQRQAAKQLAINDAVKKGTAAIQGLTAIIGSMNAGLAESATGADKANAAFSGISGAAAAAANYFFPGSGILVQGAAQLVKSGLELTGVWDDIEDSFKSTSEKLEELNTQMKEFGDKAKSFQTASTSLEEIGDRYDELAKKAGRYDENIDDLTSKEREEYNSLKDTILQYNEQILLGYNDRGEAILKNQDAVKDTIELLKEEYELNRANSYIENGNKNIQTYNERYQEAKNAYSDLQDYSNTPLAKGRFSNELLSELGGISRTTGFDSSSKSFKALEEILSDSPEDILNSKDQINTLIENLKNSVSKDFPEARETIEAYGEGIVNIIEDYEKTQEEYNTAVKQAELTLETSSKIDESFVLGMVTLNPDYNQAYLNLETAGIEDADNFILSYVRGLKLGVDGIEDYDDVFEAVTKMQEELATGFTQALQTGAEFSGAQYDETTFSMFSNRIRGTIFQINEFIKNNDDFKALGDNAKQTLLNATFGTSSVTLGADGFATDIASEATEAFDDFYESLNNNQEGLKITEDALAAFIPDDMIPHLDYIVDSIDWAMVATDGWDEALRAVIEDFKELEQLGLLQSTSTSLNNLIAANTSGELSSSTIEENEEYLKIKTSLGEIIEKYPELGAAADTFYNTNLVGTELWTQSLHQIKEALDEVALDELKEDYAEALKDLADNGEIELNLNDEDFRNQLDAVLDQDYAINVEIHSQAEEAFESIEAAMDDITEKASLIGKDFIVDANDIRELNNVFPGILEDMQILGDGTVQINDKIAQSAMDAAQTEITSSKASTLEKLHDSATELRTKQKVYQGMADAALTLAQIDQESNTDTAIHKKTITDGLATLNAEAAKAEMENAEGVATNANDNAGITAENWATAYQQSTNAAAQFATYATEAQKAIAEGVAPPAVPTISTTYTGTNGKSGEATQLDAYSELFEEATDESYAKLAKALQDAASSAGASANDIEGMMAEIAGGGEFDLLGQIGRGEGADKTSSSSDSSKSKDEKVFDDEYDRYWELNKVIENVTNSIEKLDEEQSHLHGQELINSLTKENELLDQQAKAYENLYAEQRKEAEELRAVLSGNGVTFDANGAVTNYAKATSNALAAYNSAIQQYNAGLIDDTAFETAEKAYSTFKESLESYDDLYYSSMQDTEKKLREIREQELENNLKKWETELELKLDLSEAKRDWNDFIKSISTDFKAVYSDLGKELANIAGNASTFVGDKGTISSDVQAIQDVVKEIETIDQGGSSDMFASISEAQERLKELQSTLMDDGEAIYQLYEDAWDTFLDGIDQSADKLDDLMEQFDRLDKELEFQGQLIELIYGEEAYGLMSKLYEGQERNTLKQVDSLRQQRDMWESLYQNAEEGSEAQKKYYENWTQAQDDLNSKVIDYIELLKTDYQNTINDVLKNLETSLTGSSLEDIGDEWDKLSAKSDKYYDSVESLYNIQTLANKINDSIAATDNLENQQKLQELYDREIEALREKEHLTQYDLDAANARYDIALKEIALEEAQNSKNAMKLTRGTDGNWSYQYVADEEDIANKQQELIDAYNDLYQLGKDAYQSNLEELTSLQEKYLDSYREILESEVLSEEEKEEKIAELQAYYFEQYALLAAENSQYRNDLQIASSGLLLQLYEQDIENYEAMTSQEKDLLDALKGHTVDSYQDLEDLVKDNYDAIGDKASEVMEGTLGEWTSGAQALGDIWNKDNGLSVKTQIINANNKISAATDKYKDKLDEVAHAADKDFGESGILGAIGKVEEATDSLSDKTGELVNETNAQLAEYSQALDQVKNMWDSVSDSIQSAISLTQQYLSLLTGGSGNTSNPGAGTAGEGGGAGSSSTGQGGIYGGNGGDGVLAIGDTATLSGQYYYDSNGTSPVGSKYSGVENGVVVDKINGNSYGVHIHSADGKYGDLGWVQKSQLSGFDTGGYTGEWGNDGRLALLHSKELVLNAKDTENMLSAVQGIRGLVGLSESINNSIIQGVSKMVLDMAGLGVHTNYSTQGSSSVGESHYEIQANFPNANDVESIREAILSLPNLASQYASRNKR